MPVEKFRSWKSWSRNAVPRICETPPSAAQAKKEASGVGAGASEPAKTAAAYSAANGKPNRKRV